MESHPLARIVHWLNHYIWSFPKALPWLVVVLLGVGLFITFRLALIQLRKLGHGFAVVRGKYDDPNDDGDLSHFQALSTALSATVGIGNIAGVATAIHYGGPGALFWMWVTAIFGMALKYAECTLAVRYRVFDSQGHVAGGPMHYIERGLGKRWKPLAVLFAAAGVVASFGTGNMNQANTVAVSAYNDFSISGNVVGFVAAGLVAVVILGGIKRIGRVSSTIAPLMAVIYVMSALTILLLHADRVPAAFAMIFRDAFAPRASVGGSVAGVFTLTLIWGVKRGLFSNEAGQGSAPIAHAAARTDEPVREGVVAMLEPLIDTLVICTMTGLVILCTHVWDQKGPAQAPIGHARAYQLSEIPEHMPPQHQLRALPATPWDTTTRIVVSEGRAQGVRFVVRDGWVDHPQFLTRDGTLFNGTLRVHPKQRTLAHETVVTIQGHMLQNSSALTAWAFSVGLSPLFDWGGAIVTVCVFLFAFSTMVSWSYYGDRCIEYLFGVRYITLYRLAFVCFVSWEPIYL